MIEITLFHQDELRTLGVQLGQPRPSGYELVEIQSPSQGQKQNLQGWIY
jgi:predicted metalloprotease with PDZ domain